MKRVGILTREENLNNKEILYIPKNIYNKLNGKAQVILIPFDFNDNFNKVKGIIDICDGIILPGGDDIYPLELEVVKYLYKLDKPLLGICLGMQTMGVAINGKFGHLNTLEHKSKDKYVHSVDLYKDSLLYSIIGKKKIMVNSRHKDYVVSTDLNVGAVCNDIIEEVEDKTKKCFIGVQWHPEDLEDENSEKLFNFFINKL